MVESLKYVLTCAWLMFLFIPLVAAIIIVLLMGAAGLYAVWTDWIMETYYRGKRSKAKAKATKGENNK